MNTLSVFVSTYFIYIAVAIAVLYVLFMHERRHYVRHIAVIMGSAILSWLISRFLKDAIAHPRPDLALALIEPSDTYSFPSGHASFMFGLGFAAYYFNQKIGSILLLLAILTGISRVLVGVHYWYDIVGGAVLGYVISLLVVTALRRFANRS